MKWTVVGVYEPEYFVDWATAPTAREAARQVMETRGEDVVIVAVFRGHLWDLMPPQSPEACTECGATGDVESTYCGTFCRKHLAEHLASCTECGADLGG